MMQKTQIISTNFIMLCPSLSCQDKDTKVGTCGYCGLQFKQKHHHWNIVSVFASLYKSPYWLINYVCLSESALSLLQPVEINATTHQLFITT